jgi:hypothetical protein
LKLNAKRCDFFWLNVFWCGMVYSHDGARCRTTLTGLKRFLIFHSPPMLVI